MVPMVGGQHGWADAEDGEDGEREQEDWVVAAGPWTRKEYGARLIREHKVARERAKRKAQKLASERLHQQKRLAIKH